MAHRIHNMILRGEIDCRIKGQITGTLTPCDGSPDIHLELIGLPNPDLAGLHIRFEHPNPTEPLPCDLGPHQEGFCGDITASRKHRILDVPIEEAWNLGRMGLEIPEHQGNILYLEWFSKQNGRVVLELPEAPIELLNTPDWQMTPEEVEQQHLDVQRLLETFLADLDDHI